jgi:hypothetical protein
LAKLLAPKEVLFVGDIPKTPKAKVMRRIVRVAYSRRKAQRHLFVGKPSVAGRNQTRGCNLAGAK